MIASELELIGKLKCLFHYSQGAIDTPDKKVGICLFSSTNNQSEASAK